uniref:TOX high mobility group box family member 2 n=1 Tax=Sinocyclocheilus rhinocerous TaxID=307959 RepID=A0A673J5X3_9TELE
MTYFQQLSVIPEPDRKLPTDTHPKKPLMDPESGYLCPSIPHNGLINPYSYPELPALMMSNMLAQDGHLLSSHMPSVSPALLPYIDISQPHPPPQAPPRKRKQSTTQRYKNENNKALAFCRHKYDVYVLCLPLCQTYSDPVESKSAQSSQASSHMMPPNAPLYSVPPQPSSPYLGPSPFPLSDLQSYSYAVGAPRHGLPRSAMLPALSASPPASFQISPPLHQQLSLHQGSLLNQPIRMQQVQSQPIISHQMGLQAPLHSPPPGQQGFSHLQSEYQKSVGGSQSPGAPNPAGQNPDWDSEYCNRECGGNHCR